MVTKLSRQATEAPESTSLAALAKLATASYETLEHELRAKIAALEGQALRFETVINNISQGICFFDVDERLILSNRRYAEIYRIAPEQLQPGLTLGEIVQRRVAAGTSAMASDAYLALAQSINSGAASRIWTASLADGRTIQVCHQPMPDGGWVATHEDITELNANRLIADERISLQTLIDWVPGYLWVKDTESRFVVVNRALASDSGREMTSDMIGLTDFDLHAPERARKFRLIEQNVLNSGQPMIDEEEFVVDASGAGKWLSSTKVPLRNVQNDIFGLVGIAHDITARKQADVLRNGQAHILEMIAMSAPLEDVLDRAGPRLPVPVAVAIALSEPQRVLLAIGGAGGRAHLHFHQPLGGKADHLPQQIGIRGLLHERAQVHHVVGHRWSFRNGLASTTKPYRKAPMTTDTLLTRY